MTTALQAAVNAYDRAPNDAAATAVIDTIASMITMGLEYPTDRDAVMPQPQPIR